MHTSLIDSSNIFYSRNKNFMIFALLLFFLLHLFYYTINSDTWYVLLSAPCHIVVDICAKCRHVSGVCKKECRNRITFRTFPTHYFAMEQSCLVSNSRSWADRNTTSPRTFLYPSDELVLCSPPAPLVVSFIVSVNGCSSFFLTKPGRETLISPCFFMINIIA